MKPSLEDAQVLQAGDGHIFLKVEESQARFKRVHHGAENDTGLGEFYLLLNITALQEAVYIPISLASGKKPTGLVYQIEGTGQGLISTTDITCKGDGVADITLGTLRYAQVPMGKTATFRILIEMKGTPGREYRIVINRVNYKLSTSAARYKKFDTAIGTKVLQFR